MAKEKNKIIMVDQQNLKQQNYFSKMAIGTINENQSQIKFSTQKMQKFFNYILQFKTGQRKSYSPQETKQNSQKQHKYKYCSQNSINKSIRPKQKRFMADQLYFDDFSTQNDQNLRQSKQLSQEDYCKTIVHNGYKCDACNMNPIVGQRYHCSYCDYDVCAKCYSRYGNSPNMHQHQLSPVNRKNSLKRKSKTIDRFSQKNRHKNANLFKSQKFPSKTSCSFI